MNARSSATKNSEVEGSIDHDGPDTHEDGFFFAPNPYVSTAVPMPSDDLMLVLQLRRGDDPQDSQLQLVSGADHFAALPIASGQDLRAVGLLIPGADQSALSLYLTVSALFGRVADDRLPRRYLAITDTGTAYVVPSSPLNEVFQVRDWMLLYVDDAKVVGV